MGKWLKIKRSHNLTISVDTLFIISSILIMFKSNRILYVRPVPQLAIYLFSILVLCLYVFIHLDKIQHTSRFAFTCCSVITLIWMYDQCWVGNPSILTLLGMVITISYASLIIMLNHDLRRRFLNILTSTVTILLGIALFGWGLFLAGIPLPHYTDTSDPYYIHTIYFLFNLNGYPEMQIIPRFAGPFLEPGHCGTMSIFLLYINGFNLKKLNNIILLLSVLLSLSLAAYGLLVGAIILILYNKRKYISIIAITGIFIVIGVGAMTYNDGDNALNTAIVARLEMDDSGNMAGSNRTSAAFDRRYDKYLKSDQLLMGVGNEAFGTREDGSDNITIGCASYKRYFFLRGILGSSLILFFLFFYFWKFRSRQSMGFLIVYLVANAIRDYPTMEMWMYLYLLAIPVLGKYHKSRPKNSIQNIGMSMSSPSVRSVSSISLIQQ